MNLRPLDDLNKTTADIIQTEEMFAVEALEIRGVTFRTFKNGPQHVRDLLDICLHHADADFLVYEDERFTFAEFHGNTYRLAKALTDQFGINRGDRVALSMRNVPEYPMLFLALASMGAIPVFLNSWWTPQELEYAFQDCQAKLAFVDEPRSANMESFAERIGIKRVLVRTAKMERIAEFWSHIEEGPAAPSPKVEIHPDDDFAVMYTSGSSGRPKGVVLTHRSAVSAVQTWLFSFRLSERMGWLPAPTIDANGEPYQPSTMITTPFFHISATHAGILLAIWFGLKVVIIYKWDPVRAVELIEREKVSRFACVPTMSAELLAAAQKMGAKMASLRTVDSGGAKRPASQVLDIFEQVPHAMPGTGFGMTESGGIGIGMRGETYRENPDASGRLQVPLIEMRIVDDDDNDVPVGTVGELVIKSVCNMRCYLNQPEATAKALRDGWLYTGDLAKIDDNEIITIVDRKKDIIIRGGENIACSDVQAALHMHPDVIEAAVFPVPDERLGEDVGACVYLEDETKTSEGELRAFLSENLAPYKVPKKIWIRDTPLPRGATEKIDRLAVRAEYAG